ncbi:LuxR C-terminal-related transcriptional regulator, partial [Ferrimicrobium acidiphilum]|uniref:LuxR C-terminal-related transcriptional regulator n=1 Tax=Ferrimicrobium acidiphilum TaxID=121039 RepID=UPI0023F375EE
VLAGASGYLLKEVNGAGILDAVRRVAQGEDLLDRERAMRLRTHWSKAADDPRLRSLTPTEHRILLHVAAGLTNRQIGETMSLAEKTVKNYVSSVLAKMGMERRTQAAVYAATHGLPRDEPSG